MAVAPLRRRAGMIEIKERERKAREETRKQRESMNKEEVTKEEHEERIKKLKEIGLIK